MKLWVGVTGIALVTSLSSIAILGKSATPRAPSTDRVIGRSFDLPNSGETSAAVAVETLTGMASPISFFRQAGIGHLPSRFI
jgi:hypothetical protein